MSEKTMRSTLLRVLKPLDAVPVENPIRPGTPDINFVDGWLELKWVRRWPVRNEEMISCPHFTPQQRVWLTRRWKAGGNVWLIMQINRIEWLLFRGDVAAMHFGKCGRAALHSIAYKHWPTRLKVNELIDTLTFARKAMP